MNDNDFDFETPKPSKEKTFFMVVCDAANLKNSNKPISIEPYALHKDTIEQDAIEFARFLYCNVSVSWANSFIKEYSSLRNGTKTPNFSLKDYELRNCR